MFTSLKLIAILDCPEFHKLILLLHNDLKDSNIPHQMKGRVLIIKAWKTHFMALHAELAVLYPLIVIEHSRLMSAIFTECCWSNFFQQRSLD